MPNASWRVTDGSTNMSQARYQRQPARRRSPRPANRTRSARPSSPRQSLERRRAAAVARRSRPRPRAPAAPEQHVHALVRHQPADEQQRWAPRLARESRRRAPRRRRRSVPSTFEPERNHHALVAMRASAGTSRASAATPRRCARRGAARTPGAAVEQPVPPPRPDDLAVEPDDQRRSPAGEPVGHQRHRVRLVQHHDVGSRARQPERQRRGHRHRADRGQAADACDRHAVDHLVDRRGATCSPRARACRRPVPRPGTAFRARSRCRR